MDTSKAFVKKPNVILKALTRVLPYMGLVKLLMNSFSCCTVRLLASNMDDVLITTELYERCLWLICGDKTSSYEELL